MILHAEYGLLRQFALGQNAHAKLQRPTFEFLPAPMAPTFGSGFQHIARIGSDIQAKAHRKEGGPQRQIEIPKIGIEAFGPKALHSAHKLLITRAYLLQW